MLFVGPADGDDGTAVGTHVGEQLAEVELGLGGEGDLAG